MALVNDSFVRLISKQGKIKTTKVAQNYSGFSQAQTCSSPFR